MNVTLVVNPDDFVIRGPGMNLYSICYHVCFHEYKSTPIQEQIEFFKLDFPNYKDWLIGGTLELCTYHLIQLHQIIKTSDVFDVATVYKMFLEEMNEESKCLQCSGKPV